MKGTVTTRMPEPLKVLATKKAEAHGWTLSQAIRWLLADWVRGVIEVHPQPTASIGKEDNAGES